jgi:hypothetical protein
MRTGTYMREEQDVELAAEIRDDVKDLEVRTKRRLRAPNMVRGVVRMRLRN